MELTDTIIQSYRQREGQPPCISLYIPTHPQSTSQRINDDKIRFKNALQQLEERAVFSDSLASVHGQLVDLIEDNDFWLHQDLSLAVFADRDGFETVRLPYEMTSVAQTGDHYAISPLSIMQNMGHTYYIVDIDFEQPRLHCGSSRSLQEVLDVDLPEGIDPQTTVESGADVDDSQVHNVNRYLRRLAESVDDFLADKTSPLFVVGSQNWASEFRSQLHYDHVLPDELAASHEQHQPHELQAAADSVVSEIAQQRRQEAAQRYHDTDPSLRVEGRKAVAAAADEGKVETLLVPVIRTTTDSVRSDSQPSPLIELPEEFAVFDSVVRQVVDQSGVIIPVEQDAFGDDLEMRAILRF